MKQCYRDPNVQNTFDLEEEIERLNKITKDKKKIKVTPCYEIQSKFINLNKSGKDFHGSYDSENNFGDFDDIRGIFSATSNENVIKNIQVKDSSFNQT